MPTSGLIHHWCPSLDPNPGGEVLSDLAGQNDGAISSSGAWEDSEGQVAIKLNPSFVTLENNVVVPEEGYTLSMWVNITAETGTTILFGSSLEGMLTLSGRLIWYTQGPNGTQFHYCANYELNRWYHWAVKLTGPSAGLAVHYLDGVPTSLFAGHPATNEVTIAGMAHSASSRKPNALIDDLRIYDRVITDEETRLLASRRGYELPRLLQAQQQLRSV